MLCYINELMYGAIILYELKLCYAIRVDRVKKGQTAWSAQILFVIELISCRCKLLNRFKDVLHIVL